jgi:hypothetical protein
VRARLGRSEWHATAASVVCLLLVGMADCKASSPDRTSPKVRIGTGTRSDAGSRQEAGTQADAAAKMNMDSSVLDAAVGSCGPCAVGSCCGPDCVDLQGDFRNCGSCGNKCPSEKLFCDHGECKQPVCSTACGAGLCCSTQCCNSGEGCCFFTGPFGPQYLCVSESQPCPRSCRGPCM